MNPVAAPAWANLSVRTPSCRLSAVALLSWTQATLLRRPTASRISGQRSRIEPASAAVAAAKAHGGEREFYSAKIRTAAFYAAHVLPVALGLARVIDGGAASVVDTDAGLI